jgi:hypothetical protein
MDEFSIGDTVQMTGTVMTGNVGTVVAFDDTRGKVLVRVTDETQNWFAPEDLRHFTA